MKRLLVLLIAFLLVFNITVKADEGMWFLAFINKNYEQMKAKGFKLTAKDIYDINNSSLKDAIVVLDRRACTGEIVSQEGLLFTNHHCGYDEIQQHSTVQQDYLTDGFWAKTKAEELSNPGKTVSFLVRMEDVTDQIIPKLSESMPASEREMTIRKLSSLIEKKATEGTNYEANVKSFFDGNNYYLCVYEVFKDIRLVGAPPSSIGKYGGDTDNWMWYRHTGDFCIFRVYCAPDGSPAEYSPNNVPYHPKRFLNVNIGGVKEGDFAMIMGYPGSTNRYLTSWGVKEKLDNENSIRIKVGEVRQKVMKTDMDANADLRIKYAAKYAYSMNFYKLSLGQNQCLASLDVIEKKQKIEKQLRKWIKKDKSVRVPKYGETLKLLEEGYTERAVYDKVQNYWFEAFYMGPAFVQLSFKIQNLLSSLQNGDSLTISTAVNEMRMESKKHFKEYDLATDKKLMVAMFKVYAENIEKEFHPPIFATIQTQFAGDYAKFADELYANSIFVDEKKFNDFLDKPTLDAAVKDLAFKTAMSTAEIYYGIQDKMTPANEKLEKGLRLFSAAYLEMQSEKDKTKVYYPDANSTMRLTYGTVGGYKAGEKNYNYFTDLDGYMAKEKPNDEEFKVAPRLKELWKAKDYGQYGTNGKLNTCFIANTDITGGNSGSPVLNANGELIGIAFDGNWEAMSGDIAFEPALQRTICVDIRFVLFVVEKYAGAKNIIDELKLVK